MAGKQKQNTRRTSSNARRELGRRDRRKSRLRALLRSRQVRLDELERESAAPKRINLQKERIRETQAKLDNAVSYVPKRK